MAEFQLNIKYRTCREKDNFTNAIQSYREIHGFLSTARCIFNMVIDCARYLKELQELRAQYALIRNTLQTVMTQRDNAEAREQLLLEGLEKLQEVNRKEAKAA